MYYTVINVDWQLLIHESQTSDTANRNVEAIYRNSRLSFSGKHAFGAEG
jgi:hypothetical protein